jgi:hypothetical protein
MVRQSGAEAGLTDLEAAVAQGVLTPAQVEALRGIAAGRQPQAGAPGPAPGGDNERFRLLLGFNDVFFAIGVVLLGLGLAFFLGSSRAGSLLAAALMWGVAEVLVRGRRLVLPGMAIAAFLIAFVFLAVDVDWGRVREITGMSLPLGALRTGQSTPWALAPAATVAVKALAAAAAATAFYVRFRLPFALLLIACGLVGAVDLAVAGIVLDGAPAASSLVLLACGIAVFAAAMAYDLADRERTTRHADCAFWLHLLAAPLIVHALIGMVTPLLQQGTLALGARTSAAILAIVAVLTIVAIVVDRRALFVSALSYLGIVIGSAIAGATGTATGKSVSATLLILGAIVIGLGLGWQGARRAIARLLPAGVLGRLPPVA